MTRAVYRRKEDDNPLPLLLGCSTRSIRMAIDTLARDRTDVGEREGGALEGAILWLVRERERRAGVALSAYRRERAADKLLGVTRAASVALARDYAQAHIDSSTRPHGDMPWQGDEPALRAVVAWLEVRR
jgi:hypothetical protein